ncbi:Os04g0546050 [Oryza sativa Japonica Group]|uniref:Os04g0546050 protein n=1 Tax=Oryza sativa subsp. japonica TaxID=39947 RepID=A0A0N7KJG3_ORYSJ|nr:Os04g0546050 [Oryza sativa Japonica Group]
MGFYQKKAESPNQTTLKSAPLSRDLPALGPQTAVRASSFASSNVTHLPTQPEVNSWDRTMLGPYVMKETHQCVGAESPNQTTLKSAPLSRDLPALGPQTAVRASSFASSNVTHLLTQPEVNSWDRTMLGPNVMEETHQCVGVGLPVVAGKKEFEANPNQGAGSNALYCPRDRWLQL